MRVTGGRYVTKNGRYRELRSIKLSDQAWQYLDRIAQAKGLTRGDLIEYLYDEQINPLQEHPQLETQLDLFLGVVQAFLDNLYGDNPHKINSKDKAAVSRFILEVLPGLIQWSFQREVDFKPPKR